MSEQITPYKINPPVDLKDSTNKVLTWAKSLVITTPQHFEDAAERLKQIKQITKGVTEFFSPMKRRADESKKAILDAEKQLSIPLAQAEQLAKTAMLTYQQEQARIAEKARQQAQAKADEAARREREAALKKADAAVKPETKQKYEELAAMVTAPVIQVPSASPAIAGVATRKLWKWRLVNEALLPRAFLCPDEKKLNQYATAMREQAQVCGVEFYQEETLAVGGR